MWNAIVNQAILTGMIYKDVDNYGILKLMPEGKKFIKKPYAFLVTEDNDFEEDGEQEAANVSGGTDQVLYRMLIDLRKSISKKLQLPPYVIFQDGSIDAMSTLYPITIDELKNIPGVGEGKAKRYGKEFCELIKRHCEDNEIERPMDIVVRSVPDRSKNKLAIIKSIDAEKSLDEMSKMLGLSQDEVLDEMEAIVYSGTKLNVDYMRRWWRISTTISGKARLTALMPRWMNSTRAITRRISDSSESNSCQKWPSDSLLNRGKHAKLSTPFDRMGDFCRYTWFYWVPSSIF